ncbi:MAG TPA: YkgJ family cysteine cluster protein, partial [Thermoanaerobaculia bacterium]|nr:YkgJ family cysteine cluster protein [Thermoanaerobaculia bacterium]
MPDYKEILTAADRFFSKVAGEQPAALACRVGCTLCCHGLFEISAADVSSIAQGVAALDPDARRALIARAEAVIEATDHPALRECTPAEKEAFFARADDVACPALDPGGACLIYEHRPLVCRTFGLPLRDGAKFIGEECELNFLDASRQEREAAAWDLQWEDELGPEDEFTIPEAIV